MINTKQKIIIVVLLFVALILAIFFIYSSKKKTSTPTPIEITNSTPIGGAVDASVFDPIIITFNQPVDFKSLYITSDPYESWDITQNSPNSITLGHKKYLNVSTTYKITVLQNGNLVGDLTFKTTHEQNDPQQLQSLQSELDRDYPLGALTPFETSEYRIVYSAPLTLEISIKRSTKSQQEIVTQVESWVRSQGVDPTTHKYIVIFPPTPAP